MVIKVRITVSKVALLTTLILPNDTTLCRTCNLYDVHITSSSACLSVLLSITSDSLFIS